jgi:hypothetical protein
MLQGYFDESGTAGNDRVVSLAGFITTTDRWVKFSDAWDDLLKRYKLPVFKMHKESKRKPVRERDARIAAFADVIKKNLLYKIECSVGVSAFGEIVKGKLFPRNRNARIVDEYYLWVFHNLIARLCEGIWERGFHNPFDVFFDEQLKYGPQAAKFYRIALDVAKPRYRRMLPEEPIFRKDHEFRPLRAQTCSLGWCANITTGFLKDRSHKKTCRSGSGCLMN